MTKKPLIIVPEAIARAVVEEASFYLEYDLPHHWIRRLTHRAYVTLECNADFRRKIERGNNGRDLLWSFMRHWLCALMAKELPHLHSRLPSEYNVGRELPPPPPTRINLPCPPQRSRRSRISLAKSFPPRRIHGLLPEPV
jgi:hypothetical protein